MVQIAPRQKAKLWHVLAPSYIYSRVSSPVQTYRSWLSSTLQSLSATSTAIAQLLSILLCTNLASVCPTCACITTTGSAPQLYTQSITNLTRTGFLFILPSLDCQNLNRLMNSELKWGWREQESFTEAVMAESLFKCHLSPSGLWTHFWKFSMWQSDYI